MSVHSLMCCLTVTALSYSDTVFTCTANTGGLCCHRDREQPVNQYLYLTMPTIFFSVIPPAQREKVVSGKVGHPSPIVVERWRLVELLLPTHPPHPHLAVCRRRHQHDSKGKLMDLKGQSIAWEPALACCSHSYPGRDAVNIKKQFFDFILRAGTTAGVNNNNNTQ